jgi:hypothetical protein
MPLQRAFVVSLLYKKTLAFIKYSAYYFVYYKFTKQYNVILPYMVPLSSFN